jgi:hypothetical protein
MKKISREDLNTIRKAVKHITDYIQSGRGGGRCYGCPVSSANNRLGTACRVFINDIGKNELIGVKCKDLIGPGRVKGARVGTERGEQGLFTV